LESSLLKIIAPNSDLKGKSFEKFMQLVLDKLGYDNFKVPVSAFSDILKEETNV
jgi:hypothetical protein